MSSEKPIMPELRGITDPVKPLNAEHLIETKWTRLKKWMDIPTNAVVTLITLAIACWFCSDYGIGIYLIPVAWFLKRYFLTRKENPPLKIPVQDKLIDIHQLNPGNKKPEVGKGIFFLGNQLFSGKEIWLTNDDARQHFLVMGTTGAGKAIRSSALVHTETGWKIAGDVRVGEMITTPFGETARVTGVFPQGRRRIWKMTFEDGRVSEIDGEHLWEIHHKHWNGKYKPGVSRVGCAEPRIMTTRELRDLKAKNKGTFSIVVSDPPEKPAQDLPIPAYVMGALLGDGCFKKTHVSLTSEDACIVERVRSEMAKHGYETVQHDRIDYGFRRGTANIPLHHIIKDLGLAGTKSYSKFIPEIYLEGSIEQRWALLQGLMDTDGTCDSRKVALSFSTSSEKLAQDVQKLVWSLGGIAKINPKATSYLYAGKKRNGEISYTLTIRMKTPELAFHLKRKKELASRDYQYKNLKLTVVSVEETEVEDDCVCFMVDHPRHLFVMEDYISTHNTELLLAFAANALSWGSGLIFVDGKGDIKTMGLLFAMAKLWGRDADFLLLNFMPPPKASDIAPGEDVSNTMNPYTTAEADDIKQQVNGMMPAAGGDGMWKDRAMVMLEAVLLALCWGRDAGIIDISLATIRKYITLDELSSFLTHERFVLMPEVIKENIRLYLSSLGAFDFEKLKTGGKQDPEVVKQHGFLEMQLSGPFAALANQYGAIFNSDFGEVDMFDVVLNRRILIALLPSLAKSADDTQRMGKIIVGALKSMMGKMLGNLGYVSDPTVKSLMEVRLTNSPSPVIAILDECGYYTVNGMAVIAAQARSLGFSMVYAAQDIKAMTRYEDKEAQSIIANTNTKIIMRTEDSDTTDIAVKGGGKASRVRAKSYQLQENSGGIFSSGTWTPDLQKAIEFEDRIDGLDLKNQSEGEFTVLFKSLIVRGQGLYTDATGAYNEPGAIPLAPNQFILVRKPDADVADGHLSLPKVIMKMTSQELSRKRMEIDARLAARPDEIAVIEAINQVWVNTVHGQKRNLREVAVTHIGGVLYRMNEKKGITNSAIKNIRRGTGRVVGMETGADEGLPNTTASARGMPGVAPAPATSAGQATMPPRSIAPQDAVVVPPAGNQHLPDADDLMDHGVEIDGQGIQADLGDVVENDRVRKTLAAIRRNIETSQAQGLEGEEAAVLVSSGVDQALDIPDENDVEARLRDLQQSGVDVKPAGDASDGDEFDEGWNSDWGDAKPLTEEGEDSDDEGADDSDGTPFSDRIGANRQDERVNSFVRGSHVAHPADPGAVTPDSTPMPVVDGGFALNDMLNFMKKIDKKD